MESVYQDCLAIELRHRGIPAEREATLRIEYRGETIPSFYRADFLIGGAVVELKAKQTVSASDEAQVVNYLRATGLQVGLLFNFGERRLVTRRFVNQLREGSARSAGSA